MGDVATFTMSNSPTKFTSRYIADLLSRSASPFASSISYSPKSDEGMGGAPAMAPEGCEPPVGPAMTGRQTLRCPANRASPKCGEAACVSATRRAPLGAPPWRFRDQARALPSSGSPFGVRCGDRHRDGSYPPERPRPAHPAARLQADIRETPHPGSAL